MASPAVHGARFRLKLGWKQEWEGVFSPMKTIYKTMFVDIGVLAVLVLLSVGFWYSPWATVALLAMLVLGGFILGRPPHH